MKSTKGLAVPFVPSFADAPDIHLLLMAALVLLAGLAGGCTMLLLLLMAPLAKLALDHIRPSRQVAPEPKLSTPGLQAGVPHNPAQIPLDSPRPLN
ncbi:MULTISPECIES: hypothetical protein [unclassified Paenarthrobacter]|uniref:hypothetical protein n=1 Tax=unclassified Paenarthrobacter TaxID=2634190 RepID=UPI001F25AC40|nr:hypothetical protein [Paenarthrobacter sp. AR 02]MCF3139781.1 hypothetical protein [Paenarthrobacter sp. AR 02]